MRLVLFSLLAISKQQLQDSVYTVGQAESIPNILNNEGFNQLFNLSTRQQSISKGDKQLFFLRWFSYDGDASTGQRKSFTSAFEVKVDDYSQLVIPNSFSQLVPQQPSNGAYRNISLLYYRTNPVTNQKRVICALTPRRMWIRDNANNYAVPGRTVLVTVRQGQIVGCDWAPSTCIGNPTARELDSICSLPCYNNGCSKFNITAGQELISTGIV